MRLEPRLGETDEADERSSVDRFDRPEAPAAFGDRGRGALRKRVALCVRQWDREVPHHLGIGVELCERVAVVVAPLAEHEPLRTQLHYGLRSSAARASRRRRTAFA